MFVLREACLVLLQSLMLIVERYGASQVALMVKSPPANAGDVRDVDLAPEDPLEEGVATPCSILAWRTPWRPELGKSLFCKARFPDIPSHHSHL